MRSVKEFFKPVSAKMHAAALNLQGTIGKQKDDEANAAKKIIADDNHLELMLRSEAANAKKRRINRIKDAKDNEVAHETMSDEGIVRNNINQQLLLGENIPGLQKRALVQTRKPRHDNWTVVADHFVQSRSAQLASITFKDDLEGYTIRQQTTHLYRWREDIDDVEDDDAIDDVEDGYTEIPSNTITSGMFTTLVTSVIDFLKFA